MIQSLHIKNLQSHKDSHLDFCEGVNVIVGPSDSGKSAILRALRWLVKNRPQGDVLRSHWGGGTEASISLHEPEIDVDPEVTRMKGKTDEYTMNGNSFKALRGDVPQEIQEVLNITDINLQRQLDSPFLLSEAPGAVAAHFNKVANLDKIDSSTQYINGCIRELNADIKRARKQITEYKNEVRKFDILEEVEIELQALEELEKRLKLARITQDKLNDKREEYLDIQFEIEQASSLSIHESTIKNILVLYEKKERINTKKESVCLLLSDLQNIEEKLVGYEKLIPFENQIQTLLTLYKKREKEEEVKIRLSKAVSSYTNISTQLTKEEAKQGQLLKVYNNNFPNVCPLCGKPK